MDSTFLTELKMVEWFRNSFLGCLKVPGDEEQDRINDLPDHILSHIISFLPIKEAVQTSVLSKRWIDIWRFITSLDFDEGSFINSRLPRKFHNLENIVDKVCSPIIHSFTLSGFYSYHYDSLVHSWISSILERKIQKLDIYYPALREFNFPSKLFECNAMIEINLQLKNCFLNVHAPLHHPNLQILRLTGFVFKNCLSSSEALLDFPLVKVFKLKECTFSNVQKLRINTPRAKRFVFKQPQQPSRSHYYSIEVCAPSLTKLTLMLTTSPLLMFIPPNPSSIQNASVEFYFSYKPDPMHSLACQLLQSIQAVKYLKLGFCVMWDLGLRSNFMANLPTFKNLVHLQVEPMASFETLGYVLHKTPILKTLVCDKFFSGLMDSTLVLPTVVPPCFQSHLKRVTLSTFAWEDEGRGLAKFVLKNAKVLEQMTIILNQQYSSKDVDRIMEQVEEELLKSPRGSPHVKVKVLWWRLLPPQIP